MPDLEVLSGGRALVLFEERQQRSGHTFRVLREGEQARRRPVVNRVATPCHWRRVLDGLGAGIYRLQLIGPGHAVLTSLRVRWMP